jgi:hypothetical protein
LDSIFLFKASFKIFPSTNNPSTTDIGGLYPLITLYSFQSKAFRGELGTNNPEENSPLNPLSSPDVLKRGLEENGQLELSFTPLGSQG